MTRPRNVVDFPSNKHSDVKVKLFAMLFYLFIAFLLTLGTGLSEEGLWGLALFGVLYNYFVRQRVHRNFQFRQDRQPLTWVLIGALLVLFIWVYKLVAIIALVLAFLYWGLIGGNVREAPYFLKFHMLTALVFNFFLLMPYLILVAVILLLSHLLVLFQLPAAGTVVSSIALYYLPLLMTGLIGGASLWLSISVLMGRTPYLGIVTTNVRPWI